jgi:hypothetical protein
MMRVSGSASRNPLPSLGVLFAFLQVGLDSDLHLAGRLLQFDVAACGQYPDALWRAFSNRAASRVPSESLILDLGSAHIAVVWITAGPANQVDSQLCVVT